VCCPSPVRRNSVSEELRIKMQSFNIQKQICAFLKFLCMRITGMIMKGEKLGVISKQVLFYGDPSNEGNRGSLHYAKHRNEDKANKI